MNIFYVKSLFRFTQLQQRVEHIVLSNTEAYDIVYQKNRQLMKQYMLYEDHLHGVFEQIVSCKK